MTHRRCGTATVTTVALLHAHRTGGSDSSTTNCQHDATALRLGPWLLVRQVGLGRHAYTHACVLHSCVWTYGPQLALPDCSVRVRICVPPPQEREHAPNAVHALNEHAFATGHVATAPVQDWDWMNALALHAELLCWRVGGRE